MVTVGNVVHLDLPSQDWRAVERPGGVTFVTSSDFAACAGDVSWASFSLWVAVLETRPSSKMDVVESLMQRRVHQGHPDRVSVSVAGLPATRFDYTDGVAHIHSYFVRRPAGAVIELTLSTFLHETGAPKVDLEATARDLFGFVRFAEAPRS
jgi:hypothetical protein